MLQHQFYKKLLKKLLPVLFLFVVADLFAQVQIKKNEVTVAEKKGIIVSYTYKPLMAETQGIRSPASTIEYEFSFFIENTTKDSLQFDTKIDFETSVHSTVIGFNEKLAPGEKKMIIKNIVFYTWRQYWVDRPTVEKWKVQKIDGNIL